MQDALNKVRVEGHQGPHPERYHGIIYGRLSDATKGLTPNSTQYKKAVKLTLDQLKVEISTPNTELNRLVTGAEK